MNKNNKTQLNTKKSKKVLAGPFCFFAWILKVEIIIIAVIVFMITIMKSVPDKTKFIIKYEVEKFFYADVKNKKTTAEEIFINLEGNNKLSKEEKEFIKNNLKNEIEDNIEYIDVSKVAKRVKNLKTSFYKKYKYNEISHKYEIQNYNIYLRKIAGEYNSIFNELRIYEQINDYEMVENYLKKNFDFSSCDKSIYFHELNHLLTKNTLSTLINSYIKETSNFTQIGDGEVFLESINEMFTREYFGKNEEYIYNEDIVYAYVLSEILPEDVVRKYKFYDNQSILISGLLDIDDNIDEVYKLFNSINKVQEKQGTEEDFRNIHDGFAYFYEKKYKKSMSEDLEIQLYIYGSKIQTVEEQEFIREYLNMKEYDKIIKIIPKGYFEKGYIESHKNVYIEYSQNGEIKIK